MDASRRVALGQWYTPSPVADLALALALPGQRRGARVLDPACGDGVFLARARAAGIPASQIFGIELDPQAARSARRLLASPGEARGRSHPDAVHCGDLFAVDSAVFGRKFDAVAGNPPYVRQERLSKAQKERIRRCLAHDFPRVAPGDLDGVTGRGDLAAACVLRALAFARPGARIALVVSSALLDASYASRLWRAVATAGRVIALVDAPRERWFADAAVNPVILVMEARGEAQGDTSAGEAADGPRPDPPVRVARLTVATAEAARRLASAPSGDPIAALAAVAEVRLADADAPGQWARYLRAPAVWFDFERAGGAALVPLASVAEVRRGLTSGANDVFYLDRTRAASLALEARVLVPLLRSPRQIWQIDVDPDRLEHMVLVCPSTDESLSRYPAARRYLDTQRAAAGRPTLRHRSPWWALPARPARLFLTKAYGARFVQRLARRPVLADQRVYAIHPRSGPASCDVRVLAAILNSTFTTLALESLGRASLGEGALEWTVADATSLPILDPRRYDAAAQQRLCSALDRLAHRTIGSLADERAAADRRDLDLAVASVHKDLADVLDPAWPALLDSVHHRNTRRHRSLWPGEPAATR